VETKTTEPAMIRTMGVFKRISRGKMIEFLHTSAWDDDNYNATEGDRSPESLRKIEIDRQRWEDLGEPDLITVTIEPGDKING
jgi:hypothetical protein